MQSPLTLSTTEWCPIYKWGQVKGKVIVTIFVPCLDEGNVKTSLKPDSISFRAERVSTLAGGTESQRTYALQLQLAAPIDEERSKAYLRHDHVRLELIKKSAGFWETLQPPSVPKNPNERPDFDHIGDDDDVDEQLCREKPRAAQGRERVSPPEAKPDPQIHARPLA